MTDEGFPAIEALVPHRPPMLFLDAVVAREDQGITCLATIAPNNPFVKDGQARAVLALELIAQAVAASVGLGDVSAGQSPKVGYLIGVRRMQLAVEVFEVGEVLTVQAAREWGDAELAHYGGTVTRDGFELAQATLTVYRGEL